LPFVFSVLIYINDRFQEFVILGSSLGKLLDKRIQDALGLSAISLGSIAVEIRQPLGRRALKERIDDF
jgi:hypothetical protein